METVAAFARRTGRPYAPPRFLLRRGRPLHAEQGCPVLFRYPGPCGVRDHLGAGLHRLGPPDSRLLWMAAQPVHDDVGGVRHFGTLAVLEALATAPVHTDRPGIYIGENVPLAAAGRYVWVSPSQAVQPQLAERVRDGGLHPPDPEERADVERRLHAYLEEISALQQAGVPSPGVPWCHLSRAERREVLRAARVAPLWTGRHDVP